MAIKIIRKDSKRLYLEIWEDKSESWTHAPSDELIHQIDNWVEENKLGYRYSYNGWKFISESAMTAFILKWQPL